MEVVISDLTELKKYTRVYKDKKKVVMNFDSVVFNCVLPHKNIFNFWQKEGVLDYVIILKAKKIVFNYCADCDQIFANELICKNMLNCDLINVIGKVDGECISTNIFIGTEIQTLMLNVKKIVCTSIQARRLMIGYNTFAFVTAESINNIGGKYDRN